MRASARPNPEALYLPRCWRAAATVDSADEIVLDPASMAASALDPPAAARAGPRPRHRPRSAPVTGGYAQAFWNESGRWVPGPYALFDDEGIYELRLDSGRVYRVCFYPWEGQGLANQCWNDVPTLPSADAIRGVGPNRVLDGIDAQLHTAGRIEGLIRGYPTGTQGSIEILAFAGMAGDGGRRAGTWWSRGRAPTRSRSTTSRPGTYRVCFSSQDFEFFPVFATECVGGTPTPDTGTAIEVAAGDTTSGADVEVGSAGTIRGRALGDRRPGPGPAADRVGRADLRAPDRGQRDLRVQRTARRLLQGRLQPRPRRDPSRRALLPEQARAAGIGSATAVDLGDGAARLRASRPRSSTAGRSPAASSTAMGRA